MVRRARLAALLLASLLVPGLAFAQVAYPTVVGAAPELGSYSDAGAVQMYDDGTHGDAVAGDGIWTTQVTLAPPSGTTGAWSTEYKIEPPNKVLNDSQAIGQAPQSGNALGIPLNFPAAQSYTVEFRYAVNGSTGWQPAVSVADSWNTGWSTSTPSLRTAKSWVFAGAFQSQFGAAAGGFDPSLAATTGHDDGTWGDLTADDGVVSLGVMTSVDFGTATATDAEWKVALKGANATDWTLKLGSDGWNVNGNSQGDAANASTPLNRWRPMRYEVDLERGAIQAVAADGLYGTPELSELVNTGTTAEYVEIYNSANAIVSLSGVYVADDPNYPSVPTPPSTTPSSADFDARFPDGAWIAPHAFQTVGGSDEATFNGVYGMDPTYALRGTVTPMVAAYANSIGSGSGFTNGGEFVALFTWQTGMDLVEDLDVLVYGTPSSTNVAPDKTDVVPVAAGAAYGADLMTINTSTAGAGAIVARKDFTDPGERVSTCAYPCPVNGTASGIYNGVYNPLLGGREDETSEDLTTSWYAETTATPGTANDATYTVTGVAQDGTGAPLAGVTVTATQGATTQTATSASDGTFSLTLGFGSWAITGTLTGYNDATATVWADHDAALPAPLVLTATVQSYALTGTVTDASTTSVIAGATISVSPGTQTATTDSSGNYTLTLPAGTYDVTASATGYTASTKTVNLTAAATQDFALVTAPVTVTVSGTVSDTSANPLSGVAITLDDGAGNTFSGTTDGTGAFSIAGVTGNATYTLTAILGGFQDATATVPVQTTDVTNVAVTMTPVAATVTVSGTVSDATANPLSGVSVTLDDGAGHTFSGTTDGTGAFSITGVTASTTYTLTASLAGYQDATMSVPVQTTDVTSLAVTMTPTPTSVIVSGTVTDAASSNPLANVSLTLDDGAGNTLSATSATDGTFSFTGVPVSTTYTLTATLTGYQDATQQVPVQTADVTSLTVSMTASTTTTWSVSGTVTDADNNNAPIVGATVSIASPSVTATTDAQGNFTLTGVPDGTYDVQATATGYNPGTQSVTVSGADVTGVNISLFQPTATYTLSGTITDSGAGTGIGGATVTLTLPDTTTQTTTTSAGGMYSFTGLAAGTYDLAVTASGYQDGSMTGIQISADTTQDLALDPTAAPTYTLSGTVRLSDKTSGSFSGTTVTLISGGTGSATTDASGAYQIPGLAAGTYQVRASHAGYGTLTATVNLSGDKTQDFVLVPQSTTSQPGCGCSATGGSPDPVLGLFFLGLGMMVLRRRRRA